MGNEDEMDLSKFDIADYLDSNEMIAEYLNTVLEEGNNADMITAIRHIEKAIGVDQNWIKGFLAIPKEYRCNPFDISPSGDLFWADSRNVDKAKDGLNESKKGTGIKIKNIDNLWNEIL